MESKEEYNELSRFEEVSALKELVAIVVDYYCFKNSDIQNDIDSEEGEIWKKNLKNQDNNSENENIIPKDIDALIEKTFKKQLKKFT